MKNQKFLLLICISSLLFGFVLKKTQYDEVRKVPKQKITPPGTVWLKDNLFMDETEVRNLDYLEFLYWTSKNDSAQLKSLLPDTLVWRGVLNYSEPYVLYYMRHPGYRDYPAVGISYEQAIAFCEWRSDRVNQFIYIRDHYKNVEVKWDTVKTFTRRVRYSLPTKEQWEYAANAGLDYSIYPMGYEKVLDKNNLPVSNTLEYYNLMKYSAQPVYLIKECFGATLTASFVDYTTPVKTGQPNKYGIYNLLGNVSEMIADSAFKGLNYQTGLDGGTLKLRKEDYPVIDSTENGYDYKYTFRYQKPKAWLGFRCVCEVLK
jgi:formylglycine-generating enzyme required for sulfatase activity